MPSRSSKFDDTFKVPNQSRNPTDPLTAQVERWLGESEVLLEHPDREKNIWEFLILLTEMHKQMLSSNGKNIFLKIFDDNEPPSIKPNSNAEKEFLLVMQIRNQIFRSFMAFSHHSDQEQDSQQILKQLQALKRTIESLTGVIGKKDATRKIESGLMQTTTTKQTGFFSSSSSGFGGLQDDVKKMLNYLDEKIELLSIQKTSSKKAGGRSG